MEWREYNAKTDREAVHRIWREVGWADGSKEQAEAIDILLSAGRGIVAELAGAPECLVHTSLASFRYLNEELRMSAVTGVTTSYIARKRGLASRLTAAAVARDAAEGALLAALGVFEQGYYDQLGFGSGAYDHWVSFDPAQLIVSVKPRVPRRITAGDWQQAHTARLRRARSHGAISGLSPQLTQAEMRLTKNAAGLGYDGPDGALSHYLWLGARNVERGPYYIRWMVYRTTEQFLELVALIKSLADQVRLVTLMEPPGIQMQVLLEKPFKQAQITEGSGYAAGIRSRAWWQVRICDLAGCLARTHLPVDPVRFNLRLSDPIERHLEPEVPWRGVAGDYVVTLGPTSGAERGMDPALPTLAASVNAFTRLWIGVAPASGLAATDGLAGPPDLLEALDVALRLPRPMPDWEF